MTMLDFTVTNTPVFLNYTKAAGNFVLENIRTTNVPTIILQGAESLLAGTTGATNVDQWIQGAVYTGSSATAVNQKGLTKAATRPASLTIGGATNFYFGKNRPQYQSAQASDFQSVRDCGAAGDGVQDDLKALQSAFALCKDKIIFIPHGQYLISNTLIIPVGCRVVGEAYPVLMASGANFQDATKPIPAIQVGSKGDKGMVEISDVWFSTKGAAPGAIMVEWNVMQDQQGSTSMHSAHVILGGFDGTL
jgi:glucan 1,3-beta-glucosidase